MRINFLDLKLNSWFNALACNSDSIAIDFLLFFVLDISSFIVRKIKIRIDNILKLPVNLANFLAKPLIFE